MTSSPTKDVTILFGAPGTGKTTYLIDEVVKPLLSAGVNPSRIGFMSFSRKAAKSALEKLLAPDANGFPSPYSEDDFPWFRTLHSAAYRIAGLKRQDVMNTANFRELGSALGLVFTGAYDHRTEQVPIELTSLGDRCLSIYARSKARGWSLEEEWRQQNDYELPLDVLKNFSANLNAYKQDKGIVDFTDMIDMVHDPLDVDVMILDEAQDLSNQQWAVGKLMAERAKQVFLAGDDDQRIYGFSGATAAPLLTLQAKRIVLPHSWRLPQTIKDLAVRVSTNIKIRQPKTFSSRGAEGHVSWLREADDVDLRQGKWLLLCRNRSQIKILESIARRQNVVYELNGVWSNQEPLIRAMLAYESIRQGHSITDSEADLIKGRLPGLRIPERQYVFRDWNELIWPFQDKPTWMEALVMSSEDREYIRGLRRRGESFTEPGRVRISTVHGAKGGQADNVLLLTDVSGRVSRTALSNPDDEWRVLYVGVSRAYTNLFLVQPGTRDFWHL